MTNFQSKYGDLVSRINERYDSELSRVSNQYLSKITAVESQHKKFTDLMGLTDSQLRILNSNKSGVLSKDPVYNSTTPSNDIKRAIETRNLGNLSPQEVEDVYKNVFYGFVPVPIDAIEGKLETIASFFEQSEAALKLLRQHTYLTKEGSVVMGDFKVPIDELLRKQEEAYKTRLQHQKPHNVSFLEYNLKKTFEEVFRKSTNIDETFDPELYIKTFDPKIYAVMHASNNPRTSRTKKLPTLDEVERKPDKDFPYQGRFGKFPKE